MAQWAWHAVPVAWSAGLAMARPVRAAVPAVWPAWLAVPVAWSVGLAMAWPVRLAVPAVWPAWLAVPVAWSGLPAVCGPMVQLAHVALWWLALQAQNDTRSGIPKTDGGAEFEAGEYDN
jgi:hypothetical protein